MTEFILGTAQIGMPYGITNLAGQPSISDALELLELAYNSGIKTYDTAINYGNSEALIGMSDVPARVITKLPKIGNNIKNIESHVLNLIENSIIRLRHKKLHGLLLHDLRGLSEAGLKKLFNVLEKAKNENLVENIGVSVYEPADLQFCFGKIHLDIVQSPLSVVDQRLLRSGWLKKLNQNKVTVHVRSVFLQGLLLEPTDYLNQKLPKYNHIWQRFEQYREKYAMTNLELCLNFLKSIPNINGIVVGVNTCGELSEIINCPLSDTVSSEEMWDLNIDDTYFTDPRKWSFKW